MLPDADAFFKAIVALFFFIVPMASVHLLVGGMANPRAETWQVTENAARWKRRYHTGARIGRWLNLTVLALFLVQLVNLVVLAGADCDPNATHLSAAAWNLVVISDRLAIAAFVLLALMAGAGAVWAATYLYHAHQAKWDDPRRKDGLVVHLALVPLALLLMWIAFGVAKRTICPQVIGIG